jgi:hypothetical protein
MIDTKDIKKDPLILRLLCVHRYTTVETIDKKGNKKLFEICVKCGNKKRLKTSK